MPRRLAFLTVALAAAGCSSTTDLELQYASAAQAQAAHDEVAGVVEAVSGVLVAGLPAHTVRQRGDALVVAFGGELRPGQRDSLRWVFDRALEAGDADAPSVSVRVTETDPEVLDLLALAADTALAVPLADRPAELGTYFTSRQAGPATSMTDWTCGLRVPLDRPPPDLTYTYDVPAADAAPEGANAELLDAYRGMMRAVDAVGGFQAGHRIVTAPDTALAQRVGFDADALFLEYASDVTSDPTVSLAFGGTAPEGLLTECASAIRAEGGRAFAALVLPLSRSTLRSVRFGDEEA